MRSGELCLGCHVDDDRAKQVAPVFTRLYLFAVLGPQAKHEGRDGDQGGYPLDDYYSFVAFSAAVYGHV